MRRRRGRRGRRAHTAEQTTHDIDQAHTHENTYIFVRRLRVSWPVWLHAVGVVHVHGCEVNSGR